MREKTCPAQVMRNLGTEGFHILYSNNIHRNETKSSRNSKVLHHLLYISEKKKLPRVSATQNITPYQFMRSVIHVRHKFDFHY